jgi:nucleotide-binding universal stress UspA family protein
MYNRILVPTDGSATAEAAMERANDLAKRYEADVHVLHVIDS